jgi:hypothetical protein
MTAACREENMVGDTHAIAFVQSHVSHHNTVLAAFYAWIDRDLAFVTDEDADPQWLSHTKKIFEFTIGRDVRGSLDNEGFALSEPQGSAEIETKTAKVLQFVNGDTHTA